MTVIIRERDTRPSRSILKPIGRDCPCGNPLFAVSSRDFSRKKFCSQICAGNASSIGQRKPARRDYAHTCPICKKAFLGTHPARYCSVHCQSVSASRAYELRRATLPGFLGRLKQREGRSQLSIDFLLKLFEAQNGKCALSGMTMTYQTGKGNILTNISIDRIAPKGPYTNQNIRLVCRVVNLMRRDMPDADFISWCKEVVDFNRS